MCAASFWTLAGPSGWAGKMRERGTRLKCRVALVSILYRYDEADAPPYPAAIEPMPSRYFNHRNERGRVHQSDRQPILGLEAVPLERPWAILALSLSGPVSAGCPPRRGLPAALST